MKKIFLLALSVVLFVSCEDKENAYTAYDSFVKEHALAQIEISGPASERKAEISGLTYYNGYIILLPQYPDRVGDAVYAIHKDKIKEYLESDSPDPIEPERIEFAAEGLERFNETGSGYEAIVFDGSNVYLTIESTVDDKMSGYLVRGEIDEEMTRITLDSASLVELPSQTGMHNYADEAALVFHGRVYTFYEVNGRKLNEKPFANVITDTSKAVMQIPFPNIEYRITDAALPDSTGRFWALNYFYEGDEELKPDYDFEFQKYGKGKTHAKVGHVERLLQFQITDSSIVRTGEPPIQFRHPENAAGRNWEGLAYVEGLGFVIATDYYPGTQIAVLR